MFKRNRYDLNNANRGTAVIINNENFQDGRIRKGSKLDVYAMCLALTRLEFRVAVYQNCTAKKMREVLSKYGEINHQDNDCFLCVIMSYGNGSCVAGVDGELCQINDIISPIMNSQTLVDKPKIFFIQACEGWNQIGTDVTEKELQSKAIPLSQSDIFIQYAQEESNEQESFFIQSLASELNTNGQKKDLKSMANNVISEVAKKSSSGGIHRLMPTIHSTLRKEVLFHPKDSKSDLKIQECENGFYFGQISKGAKHGKGTYYFKNGDFYSGDWVKDRRTGYGVFKWSDGSQWDGDRYEGQFLNDKMHGKGSYYFKNGSVYEGDWVDGKKCGQGVMRLSVGSQTKGDRYEGQFLDDKMHGKGSYYFKNGNFYEGDWIGDKRTGFGVFTWADGGQWDGDRYEGQLLDDIMHGQGTYYWKNGSIYVGDWVYGKQTGQGVFKWAHGDRYEGPFLDNKQHGRGKYYYRNGKNFEGDWVNGVLKFNFGSIRVQSFAFFFFACLTSAFLVNYFNK